MKFTKMVAIISLVVLVACSDQKGEYLDLNSGEKITVEKDNETGYMVNTATRKPVYLYVDPAREDTFYGRTGKKINGEVNRSGGTYRYDGDGDYVYKDGDYKLKVEADGDYKEKEGDRKVKVEADGEVKIKEGDYKKKIEEDGDVKIKDGDLKVKIDDGKKKVKTDD